MYIIHRVLVAIYLSFTRYRILCRCEKGVLLVSVSAMGHILYFSYILNVGGAYSTLYREAHTDMLIF